MATVFKSVTGGYVIKSANIKVYPCANRVSGTDTNAQLGTEYNVTNIRSGKTYVIDKPSSGTVKLSVGGYYFELLSLDASDVSTYLADSKYCNIKVTDGVLRDTVGNNNTLDYNGGSGDNYFYGLLFTTTAKTGTGWISLKFDKTKEVDLDLATVATTGNYYDLTNRPSIPSAAKDGKLTITQGNKSVAFTANQSGDVSIILTDTTYSTATTSADGLMSKDDKTKLNGIASNATKVSGTAQGNPGTTGDLYWGSITIGDKTRSIPTAQGSAISSITAADGSRLTISTVSPASATTPVIGIETGYAIPSATVQEETESGTNTTLCTTGDRFLILDTATKVNHSDKGLTATYNLANDANSRAIAAKSDAATAASAAATAKSVADDAAAAAATAATKTTTTNYTSTMNLMGATNLTGSTYSNAKITMAKGTLELKDNSSSPVSTITLTGSTGAISAASLTTRGNITTTNGSISSKNFYVSNAIYITGSASNGTSNDANLITLEGGSSGGGKITCKKLYISNTANTTKLYNIRFVFTDPDVSPVYMCIGLPADKTVSYHTVYEAMESYTNYPAQGILYSNSVCNPIVAILKDASSTDRFKLTYIDIAASSSNFKKEVTPSGNFAPSACTRQATIGPLVASIS